MLFQGIDLIATLRLSLRAAELGAQFVDERHYLRVALVLGDVGWILSNVLECSHHLGVLHTDTHARNLRMTCNDLVFCDS